MPFWKDKTWHCTSYHPDFSKSLLYSSVSRPPIPKRTECPLPKTACLYSVHCAVVANKPMSTLPGWQPLGRERHLGSSPIQVRLSLSQGGSSSLLFAWTAWSLFSWQWIHSQLYYLCPHTVPGTEMGLVNISRTHWPEGSLCGNLKHWLHRPHESLLKWIQLLGERSRI